MHQFVGVSDQRSIQFLFLQYRFMQSKDFVLCFQRGHGDLSLLQYRAPDAFGKRAFSCAVEILCKDR
ncbi:hypothetical protein SAMN05421690_10185 [Nitrosomonas sp. Nm51]|nr:hypothetical protein SAMN05421690_10185 [Nitrosomonas sp. Nm51]